MSNQSNTGKPSEAFFLKQLEQQGAYVLRLRDAADLYGLNKRKVSIFGLPSDYVCVTNNSMFFAEVKSTENQTSFSLSCFQPAQKAAMVRCNAATDMTRYFIFVHRLSTDEWYLLSGTQVVGYIKEGKKSIKWANLKPLSNWIF